MKYHFLGILSIVLLFGSTLDLSAQEGGGSYPKERACGLGDGMYEADLIISRYPGYNTMTKNFVKEGNKLYYVLNATENSDIGDDGVLNSENYLWSWDCKMKKPRKLSQVNMNGITFAPKSGEIDYLSRDYIVIRFLNNEEICSSYTDPSPNSKIPLDKRKICNTYGTYSRYAFFLFSRTNRTIKTLDFKKFSGFENIESALRRYLRLVCTVDLNKNRAWGSSDSQVFSVRDTIPSYFPSCTFSNYNFHIVDVKAAGNLIKLTLDNSLGIGADKKYTSTDTYTADLKRQVIFSEDPSLNGTFF